MNTKESVPPPRGGIPPRRNNTQTAKDKLPFLFPEKKVTPPSRKTVQMGDCFHIDGKYILIASIVVIGLILCGLLVYIFGGNKSTSASNSEINKETSISTAENAVESIDIAQHMEWNGNFIIKGRYYPVRLDFVEKSEEITECVYTNVSQGGLKMSMTGYKNGDSYTFNGDDNRNPLTISVKEIRPGHYEGYASGQFDATAIFNRESSSSETQEITFDGFHSFSGHNGANVNGEITVNGSEVTGRERYKSSYLPLSGYYDPESGQLEMTEYNGDMVTGTYEGSVSNMVFHGTFTNFKGRTYNATLHFQ